MEISLIGSFMPWDRYDKDGKEWNYLVSILQLYGIKHAEHGRNSRGELRNGIERPGAIVLVKLRTGTTSVAPLSLDGISPIFIIHSLASAPLSGGDKFVFIVERSAAYSPRPVTGSKSFRGRGDGAVTPDYRYSYIVKYSIFVKMAS